MAVRQVLKLILEVGSHLGGSFNQVFIFDDLDVLQRGGCGHGMSAGRDRLIEHIPFADELVGDIIGDAG